MIVTEAGDELTPIEIGRGRTAWVNGAEMKRAHAHSKERTGPIADVVKVMAEVDEEDREEDRRRYLLTRMAIHGEFSAIARQLSLWGIEALR